MATPRKAKKALGQVALVGTGPGDLELLTLRAVSLIGAADVVITDDTIPEAFVERARPDVEIVNAEEVDVAAVLVTVAREGRSVVRLLSGDVYAHGTAVVDALVKAKVAVEIVPGVPAALAVPAYAGMAVGEDVLVATDPSGTGQLEWPALAAYTGSVVLQLPVTSVASAAASLVDAGRAEDTPVAVTVHGTTAAQHTVVGTLADVSGRLKGLTGEAVVVLGDVVRRRDRLAWFEARPLFGWTVLVPRTRAQAGSTSDQLRGLGATPLEVPTIAVEPPRTPAPMERAIRGLVSGRYQWVAFTSTNAVKAVREKLEEFGLDARAFAGVKVAAIGEATADALVAFGIRPDLLPDGEHSSEGLLKVWPEYDDLLDPLDRVFLPRADIATETLVAGLKERGWAVDDITAYRTVRATPPPAPIREALKGGKLDAVLFTSSSTVRNLLGIAGKPHESTVIACIGPQTAATAREHGLRVDVLAATATVESLVAGLADFALMRRVEAEAAAILEAEKVSPIGGASRKARTKK